MAELNDINKIDLKKTLATQQTAKKNIKKYQKVISTSNEQIEKNSCYKKKKLREKNLNL